MPSNTKQRAQGGGRKANSEPKVQVFREFGGCNFELSPRSFTLGKDFDQEQADLEMNYVVIQNNVKVTSNKTLETRNNLIKQYTAPSDKNFVNASILIGDRFFIGLSDGSLMEGSLFSTSLTKEIMGAGSHHWTSFEYVDDKLIGMTSEQKIWTGKLDTLTTEGLKAPVNVPDPSPLSLSALVPTGDLKIQKSYNETYRYRIAVSIAYVTEHGPTKASEAFTFYANYPVNEWHRGKYLTIKGTLPSESLVGVVKAVEVYYTTGNSSSLLPAGRLDFDTASWSFDWYGYQDATVMWPIMNLIAPTQNYTNGVKARYIKSVDGRLYFWGDVANPQRLYIGGNSGNLLSTSAGTGGGFVDVEPGTGQSVKFVDKYKTQSGNSIVTILCDSKNSQREQRFNLVENEVQISNEQTMKSWQAEQVAGAVGCKSPKGAIVCEDGLYSVSRYGLALTTMTMEYNAQIQVNYVSDAVKPIFLDRARAKMRDAELIESDGVLYLVFGEYGDEIKYGSGGLILQNADADPEELDNMLFCYDIANKAWWSLSLDVSEPIIDMIHMDYEGVREGVGIITKQHVYILPLTQDDSPSHKADFDFIVQTGELATQQPQQTWQYLSQMEFRFDHFIGSATVLLTGIDQFGRKVTTKKTFTHEEAQFDLVEYMRVDLRLQSYQIRITGKARFRLTHFMAKVYTMSAKQGIVWGFDDSQSFRTDGDIHPTFKCYNDIVKAIIV